MGYICHPQPSPKFVIDNIVPRTMSSLRKCVVELYKMMNSMVLTMVTKEAVSEEELLVTMETDDVERLRRMLEEDTSGKLLPTEMSPPGQEIRGVTGGNTAAVADYDAEEPGHEISESEEGWDDEQPPRNAVGTNFACAQGETIDSSTDAQLTGQTTIDETLVLDDFESEEEREDNRRKFRIWRSTSSDVEEDEKHLKFVTGYTLLHIASKYGAVKCVEFLLETPGFYPNMYIADYGGALPIHWAVSGNKAEVVDRLVKAGSRVNIGDILGRTALHIACSKGFIDCVKALLQAGSELDLNARDPDGFTPLISTMLRRKHYYRHKVNGVPNTARHVEIMKLLISAGANLDITAKSGFSALHLSVHLAEIEPFIDCLINSNVNIDQRIVKAGQEPGVDHNDIYGPTPLWFAIAGCHLSAARKLIQANANLNVCCRKQSVSRMHQLNVLPKRDVFAEMVQQFTSRDYLGVEVGDTMALYVDTTFEKVMTPFGIAVTRDLFPFALSIVRGGYAVTRHDIDWFQSRLERLSTTELPELMAEARSGRAMLQELESVKSLQWWCRRCVRLRLSTGLARLEQAVSGLGLPSKIQDYLLLKDVFGDPHLDSTEGHGVMES